MKKNNILILGFSILSCLFTNIVLADECSLDDEPPTTGTKKYIQCLDLKINELERTQKMWITKIELDLGLIEDTKGNSQLLPIFKRSIKSQAQFLEDSCRWRYLQKMPSASNAAINYKRCKIRIITQHIEVLKQPLNVE